MSEINYKQLVNEIIHVANNRVSGSLIEIDFFIKEEFSAVKQREIK
jgi:hypothetical protein